MNLARVVYFDSDIVLLDDPLSAVDAHVGKYLFDHCILGAMKNKTRILVTHQLHVLPQTDYVIVMKNGKIAEQGTYNELMTDGQAFSELMKEYGGHDGTETADEVEELTKSAEEIATKKDVDRLSTLLVKRKDARELMTVEERAVGRVDRKVWMSYFKAAGGTAFVVGLAGSLFFSQIMRVGNDFWLVIWTNDSVPQLSQGQYIGIFWGWTVGQSLAIYLVGVFFAIAGTTASRKLHEAALSRVVHAPVNFFDTTPLGRIINRFSKDMDGIDNSLAEAFRMFALTLANGVSTFILIIYVTPFFAVALVPIGLVYYYVQAIYRSTSRELKRLDSISRSPFYAHFGETLTGLPTIRAYNEQKRFTDDNDQFLNANNTAYYYLITAQRWLAVRLESLGALMVLASAIFGVLARDNPSLTAALLGLSLTYALQVTGTLNWCVRQFTETEIAMNAVERVNHYGHVIETEAAMENAETQPAADWPVKGSIHVENLEMKYAPDLPVILKGISFDIQHREKIGVVGRTGSGKSSLMQALFRMVEPVAGSRIVIDGVNIMQLGLRDLRSRLAIIPQDPILFSGTFRRNLDPFGAYQDSELWDALSRANLKAKVQQSEEGLDAPISEGGENLSVGQRQLLCLARAIIKKPKVLIMDEATANVDYETDAIIQKCIRQDFCDTTILTIAHRLVSLEALSLIFQNTIMDYDKVMVLDAGNIVEYASPAELVDKEGGRLRAMVEETGAHNAELLRKMTR